MGVQENDYFRPLCPAHYEVMLVSPNMPEQATDPHTLIPRLKTALETSQIHDCSCLVSGCPQHYSPDLGYFELRRNDDHWNVTGSSSLRMERSQRQAICGEHRNAMFLESFNPTTHEENFRCPKKGCQQRKSLVIGDPPAYWLGEGFFGTH